MKKDKTFIFIGIELFILLLIVAFIFARTLTEWLALIGCSILLECFCFVCHLVVNDKGKQ